jgi:DNA-binding transcriptional regulator YdaS (Cro superfamily)
MAEITEQDLIADLRNHCEIAGSQKEWARIYGFSPAYVSDVLHGRRDVSEAMADALGYRRVVRFERKEREK